MELYLVDSNRMYAQIRVGSINDYAYVDTGTAESSIAEGYTREYAAALAPVGESDSGGNRRLLTELRVFGRRFTDVPVRLQPEESDLHHDIPYRVVMTLGAGLLFHRPLHLNFAQEEIGFLDSLPSEHEMPGRRLPLANREGPALFRINLGRHPMLCLFDTGTPWSLLSERKYSEIRSELVEVAAENDEGNALPIRTYQHPALEIDGYPYGELRFRVGNLSDVRERAGADVDIVFGYESMLRHNWIIDMQGGILLMY